MEGPLRILGAYESFAALHPDWSDERMMQGFVGWMSVEGYSRSTMRLYAETITSMHVRPDNVDPTSGRSPLSSTSGITAVLLGRYLQPLTADDKKQTEFRAFFYRQGTDPDTSGKRGVSRSKVERCV
jgi:hypothetical protein